MKFIPSSKVKEEIKNIVGDPNDEYAECGSRLPQSLTMYAKGMSYCLSLEQNVSEVEILKTVSRYIENGVISEAKILNMSKDIINLLERK